jgi:hypothetical protein
MQGYISALGATRLTGTQNGTNVYLPEISHLTCRSCLERTFVYDFLLAARLRNPFSILSGQKTILPLTVNN